jgi:Uma2 family endonuclease
MVSQITTPQATEIIYPDQDGQPMSDNTKQFRWIVTIKENLELLFAENPDVFIAGDLLWYPVEGNNKIRQAPDAMVVFGRPKGDRGSYQQWVEGNISPQVVFEILSPGNRMGEMARKFQFYDDYGVEEYYIYDPDHPDLTGWIRTNGRLQVIDEVQGWISPRLGIRFELASNTLEIYRPDGDPFLSFVEFANLRDQERQRADEAQQRAETMMAALESAQQRNDALAAKLQELGIDPRTVLEQ